MVKPLEYNATLAERVDLTPSLTIFKVAPDTPVPTPGAWFEPGQYLVLGMNSDRGQPEGVRRAMSIASAPEERGPLEFYIRYVNQPESDTPLTHLLWKTRAGDRLFMSSKVTGKFTLRDTVGTGDPRLKVFVAAGTGLAPFVSMVRSHHLRDAAADFGKYLVLHGASYPGDLGYRDELESYVARHRLKYRVTVSRPQESAGWTGDTGRVEDYFLPERLSELEGWLGLAPGGLQPARAVVYICGLQGTIGNTITRLVSRGFVPEHRKIRRALGVPDQVPASLFYEQYDTTPVIPIDDESFMAPLREQMRAALTTVS